MPIEEWIEKTWILQAGQVLKRLCYQVELSCGCNVQPKYPQILAFEEQRASLEYTTDGFVLLLFYTVYISM